MIPAPLRAPPTGITDAGYKVWQGAFVFAVAEAHDGRLEIGLRSGIEEARHNIRAGRLEELP